MYSVDIRCKKGVFPLLTPCTRVPGTVNGSVATSSISSGIAVVTFAEDPPFYQRAAARASHLDSSPLVPLLPTSVNATIIIL